MPIADLARVLLDEPRWVETRFMLLRQEAVVTGLGGDRRRFVAASTRWPLISIVGRPEQDFIAGAAALAGESHEILVAEEDADHAAPALEGWERVGATIHGWPHAAALPAAPPADTARLLEPAELRDLGHVPVGLREELIEAASYAPVAAALSGSAAVAFCCAAAVTETLWDVSVDTLEGYRRRGHGSSAVRCLAARMSSDRKWPVWGATDDDAASATAALNMGFEPAGRLAVFRRRLQPGG